MPLSEKSPHPYIILPFNFMRFEEYRLLVNLVGEHLFVSEKDFKKLINYDIHRNSDPVFFTLKAKHFITERMTDPSINLLAVKYRTKKDFLSHFTSLHMIEITRKCNQRCIYCQVSSQDPDKNHQDMDLKTALKIIDLILMSPSRFIKIEFQGGEPLLNYETVKYIIEYANRQASLRDKKVEFVLCTNLTMITEDILKYLADKGVLISTSLDGPENVHNFGRCYRNGAGTYRDIMKSLEKVKKYIEPSKISALMTTTRYSLGFPNEIVDEYIKNGFRSIFVRPLNPFGYARQKTGEIGYDATEFVNFHKEVLKNVLKANLKGYFVEESLTSLLLTRILTPFSTGFVDLQFPAGAGISGVMYGYNGNVYLSDEARMLANMGDYRFCLGDVHKNSYRDIFYNNNLVNIIKNSCAEGMPGCSDCAFQMYCGTDPVRNYVEQKDNTECRPNYQSCMANREIIKHLFEIISENDSDKMDVFWSWITGRSFSDIRIEA
jgi:His-Xaa-Ser system radical SAM maturase HxsB